VVWVNSTSINPPPLASHQVVTHEQNRTPQVIFSSFQSHRRGSEALRNTHCYKDVLQECRLLTENPQTCPPKSVHLAAENWHIFAVTHPSIMPPLPAASWFNLWQPFFMCEVSVWGLCRCVKLTLHQSPAPGAQLLFTIGHSKSDKCCIEPTLQQDKENVGGEHN